MFNSSEFQRGRGNNPYVNLGYMIFDNSPWYDHSNYSLHWVLSPSYSGQRNLYWCSQRTFHTAHQIRQYVAKFVRHIQNNNYPIAYHGELVPIDSIHRLYTIDLNKRSPLWWIKRGKLA
jgi:hypothetical protein